MNHRGSRSRRNPLNIRRNWLQQRIKTLKNTCAFSFSDDVFITLLICLITGRRGTLLCTHEDNIPKLRQQVEQICAGVFGLSAYTIRSERLVNSLDPAAVFFPRADTPGSSLRVRANASSEWLGQMTQSDPFAQAFGHQVDRAPSSPSSPSSPPPPPSSNSILASLSHPTSSIPLNISSISKAVESEQRRSSIRSDKTTVNILGSSPPDARPSIDSVWPNSIILTAEPESVDIPAISSTKTKSKSIRSEQLLLSSSHSTPNRAASVNVEQQQQQQQQQRRQIHLAPLRTQGTEALHRGSLPTRRTRRTTTNTNYDDPEMSHQYSTQRNYHSHRQRSMRESIMLTERGEDRQLTQVIILEHVESSDPAVIGILMELLTLGRIRDRYGIHTVPTPFLLICISSRNGLAAQPLPSFLLDQFLLSFTHEFDMIQNTPVASTTNLTLLKSPSMSSMLSMRQALLPYSEIRDLSEQYTNMPIGASVSRYIRDIVSATRNHHAVDAGITARSMLDLESVIRALATLYGRGFVTPELAMIATEKVFTHRLRLREGIRYESTEEVIADVLRAIQPPV